MKTFLYDHKALQKLRVERGLTRQELAKRARVPGGTVLQMERGSEPRVSTLAKVATALEVSPGAFFRDGRGA